MNNQSKTISSILAPVSVGELIDKITILEIKKLHQELDNFKKTIE